MIVIVRFRFFLFFGFVTENSLNCPFSGLPLTEFKTLWRWFGFLIIFLNFDGISLLFWYTLLVLPLSDGFCFTGILGPIDILCFSIKVFIISQQKTPSSWTPAGLAFLNFIVYAPLTLYTSTVPPCLHCRKDLHSSDFGFTNNWILAAQVRSDVGKPIRKVNTNRC